MKRSAILLAGDKAMQEGISALAEFLCSAIGGAWRRSEIVLPECASRSVILSAIAAANECDFSLVYFVGLGETRRFDRPWLETRAQLSSGETVTERELNTGTPRCSIIFDCIASPPSAADAMVPPRAVEVQECIGSANWSRRAYDEAMCAAEAGLVKVLATAAGPGPRVSNVFALRLIEAAKAWSLEGHGVLTYGDAVGRAAPAFARDVPGGRAEYRAGRRLRDFPFGVLE